MVGGRLLAGKGCPGSVLGEGILWFPRLREELQKEHSFEGRDEDLRGASLPHGMVEPGCPSHGERRRQHGSAFVATTHLEACLGFCCHH